MLPEHARHRADGTQAQIVRALRSCGALVMLIGRPADVLVAARGRLIIAEIKSARGRLSEAQLELRKDLAARGVSLSVWRSPQEAVADVFGARGAT